MKITVVDFDNKKIEDISLPSEIFDVTVKSDILSRVVEWQRAKARSGTHNTRTVSEISGTTKKIYRQKGTGNARHGSGRAVQFRTGAVAFGPKPRDYEYAIQKKVKNQALRMALSLRCKEKKLVILKDLKLGSHKTKNLFEKLSKINISSSLVIGIDKENDLNYIRAAKNIPHIDSLPVDGLNVLDILKHEYLCLTKASVEKISKKLSN